MTSSASRPLAADDRLRGTEVPAAYEHRQPVERGLLLGTEEVIGPVDRLTQGLVARQRIAWPTGEEPEALVEPIAEGR